MPPTTDRAQLRTALDALRADGGTALGDAISLSVQAADLATGATGHPAAAQDPAAFPAPSAAPGASPGATPGGPAANPEPPLVATVLLSDGKSSTGQLDPLDAARGAAAKGVPVYTIALGTDHGTVDVPDGQGGVETLDVPPDAATLQQVADTTGGRFFEAPTSQDLAAIYESLGSRVGTTMQAQEVTAWFAAGALVLILAGAGLSAFWFNRIP
jgi:Ca-activated chloride channel family protein